VKPGWIPSPQFLQGSNGFIFSYENQQIIISIFVEKLIAKNVNFTLKKMNKTISKNKKSQSEPKNYNKDLVDFMKKVYAKIIIDICNVRLHDEDGGCDVELVGQKHVDVMKYKDKEVTIVYTPVSGEDWVEEAMFYVNCPISMKFSDSTKKVIRNEFEKVRQLLVQNFNEIIAASGGKWYCKLDGPITPRKILGLSWDLYHHVESNTWRLKFKPGDHIGAVDGGHWIPYDVMKIYDESSEKVEVYSCKMTKEQLIKMYADNFRYCGFEVQNAQNYNLFYIMPLFNITYHHPLISFLVYGLSVGIIITVAFCLHEYINEMIRDKSPSEKMRIKIAVHFFGNLISVFLVMSFLYYTFGFGTNYFPMCSYTKFCKKRL